MIEAVIFDMDGTLIDSEPMWKEAEKQVFTSVGVRVSQELSSRTAFMTTREVTEFWYSHNPWLGKSLEQVENEVIVRVEALIAERGEPLTGVKEVLILLQNKRLKIGLATNAPSRLIQVVLSKLGISHHFHATSSAEHEVKGKPHPAVYYSTAKKLNVHPSKCIAFEDSVSGIIAANKANMITVAVPPCVEYCDKKYEISYMKLKCLADFTDEHLEKIAQKVK